MKRKNRSKTKWTKKLLNQENVFILISVPIYVPVYLNVKLYQRITVLLYRLFIYIYIIYMNIQAKIYVLY
jgi:hypothetical protein